jgi:hypothetical protein
MKIFKQILDVLFRLGISIVLLALLFKFQHVNVKRLLENIKAVNKFFLFLAFFVNFLVYALCLLRWKMLLKAFGFRLPLKRIIISFAGGLFFSSLLPSTIGGDVVRSVDLAAHTKRAREIVATVLLDRLSGCVGLVTLAIGALFFGWKYAQDRVVLLSVAIITAIMLAVLLILFNNFIFFKLNKILNSYHASRMIEVLKNLHQEIYHFKRYKKLLFTNLLFSIFIQVGSPLAFYVTALSLGQKLNLVYFFIFLPIIGAITLLPISIGGLGLRENITVFFFKKIGMAKEFAGAMSFLNSIFILILAGIGGLIYLLTIHHRRLQPHESTIFPKHT